MHNERFKVGDIVRRSGGTKPLEITSIYSTYGDLSTYQYYAKYLGSGGSQHLYHRDLVLYQDSRAPKRPPLYSFEKDSTEVFGRLVGKNADGDYVIETCGTGAIEVLKPSKVKEVLPYTIEVNFNGKTSTHYEVPKREGLHAIQPGDILLHTKDGFGGYTFGIVTKVDTKNRSAHDGSKLKKVLTQSL